MLRCIAGFIEPTAGQIFIAGRPVARDPPYRRPVNTVFQNYALFPHLTVAENIAFGPRRHKVPKADIPGQIQQALAMVGMDGFEDRHPGQLSGGQQQRVALARAIVNRPKVLLLDEPLGALDLKLRKRMQLELKHLQEKLQISFVYVTHDQEEALVMADRIAVMNEGEIVQIGSGEDIYRAPRTRFVADFIGEANLLSCRVGESGRLALGAGDVELPYRAPAGGRGDTVTLLVRPEHIDIAESRSPQGSVAIPCRVRDSIFVGDVVKVYAVTEGGQEIVLQPRDMTIAERLRSGEAVTVCWREEHGRVLGD